MELKTYFAQDASGNIMPGATVTVYEAGTATLATGLQDESGVPLANPFAADNSAKVAFYAPDGLYDITVVGNGRTVTIRAQFADLGAAVTAEKLKTARTIAITGDLSWSTSFDGSGNVTASGTLANSGVTTGTYRSVTVDGKGRVTGGSNPTTLSGYGITDAAPKNSPAFTGVPTAPNPTAGTRSQALATMKMFADEFVASLSGSGYQKLPSGLIIQWGVISYLASSGAVGTTASLPIAFPTAFLKALGGDTGFYANANGVSPEGLSQIRGWGRNSSGAYADTVISYFAIGY